MQSKKNLSKVKMSLPAIWATLTKSEKSRLTAALIAETEVSYATTWNWTTGKYYPSSKPVREAAAATISKFIGRELTADTLFPLQ